jgi:spermidine synthase
MSTQDSAIERISAPGESASPLSGNAPTALLLASIFVIAVCGLIYELLAGTLSTYLLGNSVSQFSLVIGLFLSAMGIGSFLSRYVTKNLIRIFLAVEILVGLAGGTLTLALFFSFAVLSSFLPLLITFCVLVGTMVGLEIPLLIRILRQQTTLRAALGNVLSLDYLGALAASLLFPLFLVPRLGLVRTGFLFGLLNVVVAIVGLVVFRHQLSRGKTLLQLGAFLASAILLLGFITAGTATSWLEDFLYQDEIIFAKRTPYQRIVLTRWQNDLRLFLDGNIQFSTVDEFRYHESLVHPALGLIPRAERVLILGGGDGLAAREVFKHRSVRKIDLVDLDPEITRLFGKHPQLTAINNNSLSDPRLAVYNEDAQKHLERSKARYDLILIDLPDPNNEGLGKLYTRTFYRLVVGHLHPTGILVTQATSPFYSTAAFWCIVNTLKETAPFSGGPKLFVQPYLADVPSFGIWGFVMASTKPLDIGRIRLDVPARYLTQALIPTLFVFPKDIGPRETPINRLDNQVLVRLYDKGFKRYSK